MILSATVLFIVLLCLGYLLSAYLYRLRHKKFAGSSLQTKILFWIPIYGVFLFYIYSWQLWQLAIIMLLVALMVVESARVRMDRGLRGLNVLHVLIISGGLLASYLIIQQQEDYQRLLVIVAFSSVLSDVTAFFFGNFFGRHRLPAIFNPMKYWEGVVGQLAGAFIGVVLLNTFVLSDDIALFVAIPIGVGAAIGDLFNSYLKRKVGVKDWSNFLPGHGGYIDRLSSLSMSALLVELSLMVF